MKNVLGALLLGAALSVGMVALADTSHDQLVRNSEQAIQDWQKVLRSLKKAGVKEHDSAYRRAHNALKRNEGRLKSLQSGRSHKVVKTATGAGILGTLGGLFNQKPSRPAEKKASGKPSRAKPAPKKSEKATKRPAKKASSKKDSSRKASSKNEPKRP